MPPFFPALIGYPGDVPGKYVFVTVSGTRSFLLFPAVIKVVSVPGVLQNLFES